MSKKIALVAGLLLAVAGATHAQTLSCACNAGATPVATQAALATTLGGHMACGSVGNEVWQEFHNGTSSGSLVDYKLGPSDPRDPSTQVGTFSVNADATVTYTYGSTSYKYQVCLNNGGANYSFCGSQYGGRDLPAIRVGGSSLQSCSGVTNVVAAGVSRTGIRN